MLLADLGADVIKIEDASSLDYLRFLPPQVGEVNVAFAFLNRGKRSVRLDLRKPRGIEIAGRIVEHADVLVESFRPGRMAAWGLDAKSLAAACPRLVYCSMSGYGQEGPMAAVAGHDIDYIARAGVGSMTGPEGPVVPAIQLADIGGALHAVIAILAALVSRDAQGGQHLDVSLTEAAMGLLSMHGAEALCGAEPHRLLSGAAPAYGFYACADGRHLAVGALEPKFWQRLCAALELDHLAEVGLDPTAHEARAQVQARFLERPRDEWVARLREIDCCVEPVLDVAEAYASGGRTVTVSIGGRDVAQPACPVRLAEMAPPRPPAALGADTEEVLREIGIDDDEIARLRADRVI
jgi:crotonobetainyl-CoA:carnitine CoA-transferase CaiB-like acyl-CoA transferase